MPTSHYDIPSQPRAQTQTRTTTRTPYPTQKNQLSLNPLTPKKNPHPLLDNISSKKKKKRKKTPNYYHLTSQGSHMRPLIFSRWKCGATMTAFPVREILLLLLILNKSFLLFLCLFHSLFQNLIVEVGLGCSCCHLGLLAADRPRDIYSCQGCGVRTKLQTSPQIYITPTRYAPRESC